MNCACGEKATLKCRSHNHITFCSKQCPSVAVHFIGGEFDKEEFEAQMKRERDERQNAIYAKSRLNYIKGIVGIHVLTLKDRAPIWLFGENHIPHQNLRSCEEIDDKNALSIVMSAGNLNFVGRDARVYSARRIFYAVASAAKNLISGTLSYNNNTTAMFFETAFKGSEIHAEDDDGMTLTFFKRLFYPCGIGDPNANCPFAPQVRVHFTDVRDKPHVLPISLFKYGLRYMIANEDYEKRRRMLEYMFEVYGAIFDGREILRNYLMSDNYRGYLWSLGKIHATLNFYKSMRNPSKFEVKDLGNRISVSRARVQLLKLDEDLRKKCIELILNTAGEFKINLAVPFDFAGTWAKCVKFGSNFIDAYTFPRMLHESTRVSTIFAYYGNAHVTHYVGWLIALGATAKGNVAEEGKHCVSVGGEIKDQLLRLMGEPQNADSLLK